MQIPFEPILFGIKINIHLIFEILAFFIGFRFYVYRKKKSIDIINSKNRLTIILGLIIGAYIGSRLFAFLENPIKIDSVKNFINILNSKTVMGGLFGGLIGTEITKKIIMESNSSGDLFVFPIILGISIGRIGCFLSGTNEFTYGAKTNFILGMNLGDGVNRHPIALYEVIFLLILFLILNLISKKIKLINGELFKIFMLSYFGFRFFIEFLKPDYFTFFGLTTIQWLCLICYFYYYHFILKFLKYAYKKIHLL